MKQFWSYFLISIEMPVKSAQAYLKPALPENVCESALGQSPVQGHLTAFKTRLARIPRTRFLTFFAASSRLSQTRAGASADAFLLVGRTLCRTKPAKTDAHIYSVPKSANQPD